MRLERGRLYPGVVLSSAAPMSFKLQAIEALFPKKYCLFLLLKANLNWSTIEILSDGFS